MERIPRCVYEKAVPEINQIEGFESVQVDEVDGMSLQYMPIEIRNVISKFIAEYETELKKSNPIKEVKFTESDDGKTCKFCHAELIVSQDQTFLKCPTPTPLCFTFKNRTGIDLVANEEKIKNSKNTWSMDFFVGTTSDIDRIKQIILHNKEKAVCSSYKFTPEEVNPINLRKNVISLTFPVDVTLDKEFNKKDGKIVLTGSCHHRLETTIEEIEKSGMYKIVQVGTVGKLNQPCRCVTSLSPEEHLKEYGKVQVGWENNEPNYLTVHEYRDFVSNTNTVEIKVQRITANLERKIVQMFETERMVKRSNHFHLANEIFDALCEDSRKNHYWFENDGSMKKHVAKLCAKLADEGILEKNTFDFDFSEYRQKGSIIHDGEYLGTNKEYVGKATKLNEYRFYNKYAMYLDGEDLKSWLKIMATERSERTEEQKAEKIRIFQTVMAKYGIDNGVVINRKDGEITLMCDLKNKPKLESKA